MFCAKEIYVIEDVKHACKCVTPEVKKLSKKYYAEQHWLGQHSLSINTNYVDVLNGTKDVH